MPLVEFDLLEPLAIHPSAIYQLKLEAAGDTSIGGDSIRIRVNVFSSSTVDAGGAEITSSH